MEQLPRWQTAIGSTQSSILERTGMTTFIICLFAPNFRDGQLSELDFAGYVDLLQSLRYPASKALQHQLAWRTLGVHSDEESGYWHQVQLLQPS